MTAHRKDRIELRESIINHARAVADAQTEDVLEKANTHLSGLEDRLSEFSTILMSELKMLAPTSCKRSSPAARK